MAEQLQNFGSTTVNESLTDSDTTVTVSDGSVFPATGNYRVNCEDEIMLVTARSGNDLTVTRGAESTTAAAHSSGTTIKLVLTAGGLLQAIEENGGGGLAEGTAFPGGPTTGDRFRRTDLDYLIFYYDGTRWLSEAEYPIEFRYSFPSGDSTTTNDAQIDRMVIDGDLDLYITRMWCAGYVGSTNNGSNYWTFKLQSFVSSDTPTNIDTSYNTSAGSANSWTRAGGAVDAVVDISTVIGLTVRVAKTGSPGAIYPKVKAYYRLIAT